MNIKLNLPIKILVPSLLIGLSLMTAGNQILYEQFTSGRYEISRYIRDDGPAFYARLFVTLYVALGLWSFIKIKARRVAMYYFAAGALLGIYSILSCFTIGSISSSGGAPKYAIFWSLAVFLSFVLIPFSATFRERCLIERNPSIFQLMSFCLVVPITILVSSLGIAFAFLVLLVPLCRPFV
jgi:hypothetical protein